MKKSLVFALILIAGIALVACSGGKPGGVVKGKSYSTGAWVDENTFRMTGMGVPMDVTNPVQRKRTAQEAAELDAQYRILQKFVGAKVTGASGMKDFKSTGTAVAKEASGMIRGGSVFSVTWDDQQNCEVVYEVSSPGLKKKVTSEFLKGKSMDDVQ